MNKKELIRAISQEPNFPVSQAKVAMILDTAVTVVKRTLDAGEPVKWSRFGSFVVKEIPSKRLYSPIKKEYIVTEGMRKIVFVEPRRQIALRICSYSDPDTNWYRGRFIDDYLKFCCCDQRKM